MIRFSAAIFAMMGVLALSMPGGACFLWAGLGVEHHHHDRGGELAGADTCFHAHAHSSDAHAHGEEPCEPCEPSEETALRSTFGVFKPDAQAALAGVEFSPDWAKTPDFSLSGGAGQLVFSPCSKCLDAPPPPVEVRLCRFLI